MNIQQMTDLVNMQVDKNVRAAGIMRLGAFIKAFENLEAEDDTHVNFDFAGLAPTKPESYRGFYDHLAFGFQDYSYDETPTVKDVLKMAKDAVGSTYYGYKGGDYTMTEDTPLWVAEHGCTGSTAVIGVQDLGWVVIIETGYRDL